MKTKTRNLYLFAIALLFVGVFLVRIDGVGHVARADDEEGVTDGTGSSYEDEDNFYYDTSTESGLSAYCDTVEGQKDSECTSQYDYYDTGSDSGLSAYCDTEEGQKDSQCTDVYDYKDVVDGGTKGDSCANGASWYSSDTCATGYTCNEEKGICEVSTWGKLTGAEKERSIFSSNGAVTTSTTVKLSDGSYISLSAGTMVDNGQVTIDGMTYTLSSDSLLSLFGNSSKSSGAKGSYSATSVKCGANFTPVGGVCFPTNTGLSNASIYSILSNIFSWLMGLFTTFAVGAFVISGIQYLMASGDESLAESAKKNANYAILGIIVGLSGFIVIKAIAAALSGTGYFF